MTSLPTDHIQWLGHAGFCIRGANQTIVIDPYELDTDIRADIILITHAHYDHCSPADIARVRTNKTLVITEPESAAKLDGNVQTLAPGDTVTVNDVIVEAVPAYNVNKTFHPKDKNWLGFVVAIDGQRIYHSGDTDLIEEMAAIQTDIALLPVSGTYVMTAEEAASAARRIAPKLAIPMHYDALVGSVDDARRFEQLLDGICPVTVLTS